MSPRASERRAIAGPVEDVPDARPLGTAVSTMAPLGIARVRRGRAEEGAVERLMAAPSELPQHLTVERPSGPHRHPALRLPRSMAAPEALRALAPELSHLADESVHRLRPLRARPKGESDDRRERRLSLIHI